MCLGELQRETAASATTDPPSPKRHQLDGDSMIHCPASSILDGRTTDAFATLSSKDELMIGDHDDGDQNLDEEEEKQLIIPSPSIERYSIAQDIQKYSG